MFLENIFEETLKLAVSDSGCTNIVCGKEWLKCHVDSLGEEEKHNIKSFKSNTEFKFGDGKIVTSEKYN